MSADDLARFLHTRLRKLGSTRTDVARQAKLSRETLNKLLQGQVEQPSVPTLMQLATVLQVAPLHMVRLAYGGAKLPIASSATPRSKGDHSSFVRDVTYPDHALVVVGERFEKVWELHNTGTVCWSDRFMLCMNPGRAREPTHVDVAKPEMSSLALVPDAERVPLPETPPGATVSVVTWFTAPSLPCSTMSHWRMVDAAGNICFAGLSGIWCLVTVVAI